MNKVFKFPMWKLSVSNPILPRLYGLAKIHKEGKKMRPIVSNINAPTYKLSKRVVESFNSFPKSTGLYVKNTLHFVEKVKNEIVGPVTPR